MGDDPDNDPDAIKSFKAVLLTHLHTSHFPLLRVYTIISSMHHKSMYAIIIFRD